MSAKDWWEEATHEEQVEYLQAHPSSKKKLTKKSAPKPKVAAKPAKKATAIPITRPPSTATKQNSAQRLLRELNTVSAIKRQGFFDQHKDRHTLGMVRVFKAQQDDLASSENIESIMKTPDHLNWLGALTNAERTAINYYKEDGYFPINTLLRNGKVEENASFGDEGWGVNTEEDALKKADLLESAVRKSKLFKKMPVFRGLYVDKNFPIKDLLHKGITDPAFMSTSTSAEVAGRFTSKTSHSVVIVMNLPKGSPAAIIGSAECEVLLPKGTKIVPTKIEEMALSDIPPKYIVHAEVVFAKG